MVWRSRQEIPAGCLGADVRYCGHLVNHIADSVHFFIYYTFCLSSPRIQCPHSGMGEEFLALLPGVFTKTTLTRKGKVKKSIHRQEMNRLFEGYKQAVDEIRVIWQKNDFPSENRVFGPKKRDQIIL